MPSENLPKRRRNWAFDRIPNWNRQQDYPSLQEDEASIGECSALVTGRPRSDQSDVYSRKFLAYSHNQHQQSARSNDFENRLLKSTPDPRVYGNTNVDDVFPFRMCFGIVLVGFVHQATTGSKSILSHICKKLDPRFCVLMRQQLK